MAAGPLDGIRVIDLTVWMSGAIGANYEPITYAFGNAKTFLMPIHTRAHISLPIYATASADVHAPVRGSAAA